MSYQQESVMSEIPAPILEFERFHLSNKPDTINPTATIKYSRIGNRDRSVSP